MTPTPTPSPSSSQRRVTALDSIARSILEVIVLRTKVSSIRGIYFDDLYAFCAHSMDFDQYEGFIRALIGAGLVTRTNSLLSASEAGMKALKTKDSP